MSNSYREILRSSTIIGGASVINVLVGLLRVKLAAVMLGPAGIGMIGLLQNIVVTAATTASLGFGNVGTRQIAEANGREDTAGVASARRALYWGTLFLSIVGASLVWLLREPIAASALGDISRAATVGWLSLGVALSVATASQTALLNGLRRVGDIARVNVLSSILTTTMGIGCLWAWGEDGVLGFVIASPLAAFVLGYLYVRRLPRINSPATPISEIFNQWGTLARLGAPFMLAGVAMTAGQLAVRTLVDRELGADALGHFQAAWMISLTYVGLVLTAMGTDYYPRLTAIIQDRVAVNRLVNEQADVALLLAGPLLLAIIGLAPWIINVLYSKDFGEAAAVLRWQVMGDLLKVSSFPLGFIVLARGDGMIFLAIECTAIAVFVGLTRVGIAEIGVLSTGVAFFGMYLIYLPLVFLLARWRTGFACDPAVLKLFVALLGSAVAVHLVAVWHAGLGAAVGVLMSGAFGIFALKRLASVSNPLSPAARMAKRLRKHSESDAAQ